MFRVAGQDLGLGVALGRVAQRRPQRAHVDGMPDDRLVDVDEPGADPLRT